MATKTATATGNWSTMTWAEGGTPGAGDTVEAGGYTVTIDQDVTVGTLQNTAGGGYSVTSGGRTITANIIAVGATCVTCSHTSGTVAIVGNITGSAATTSAYGVRLTGAGGTTAITGNVTGGGATTAYGLSCAVAATCTITGSVYGKAAHGINISAGTLTLNGTSYGSDTTASIYGISQSGSSTVTATAAQGGTQTSSIGISCGSTSQCAVGTATGGTGSASNGVMANSSSALTVVVDVAIGNDGGFGGTTNNMAEGVYGLATNASSIVRVRVSRAGAHGCAGHRGAVMLSAVANSYIEARSPSFAKRKYVPQGSK